MNPAFLKRAAANASGMPPPPPLRAPPHSSPLLGRGGGSAQPDCAPIPLEEVFDTVEDVPVGGDRFRVYRNGGPGGDNGVVVALHGAGCSAASWGLCGRELAGTCGFVSFDMRGHGGTRCEDDASLSTEQLTSDALRLLNNLFPSPSHKVLLAGHSLGGALVTRLCARRAEMTASLVGCVVVDVVEGTALDSLRHMKSILTRRPASFPDLESVVRWGVAGAGLKNQHSARVSMPSQVERQEQGCYTWRTDLMATEPYWEGWFKGMGAAFLSTPVPKLLLLAGTDRLDKDLAIAHMQGKFQLSIVYGTGHFMQEDKPGEVAEIIARFFQRFTAPLPGLPPRKSV